MTVNHPVNPVEVQIPPLSTKENFVGKLETVAKAIYDSHRFKKPWDHKDTMRLHHKWYKIAAAAALRASEKYDAENVRK